jgi:DNA repair protein RadC
LSKTNLHEGHRKRLRQQALYSGLDNFSEHQVLELILSFYLPRVDTNPIAHRLIKEFGSLAKVLESKSADLLKVEGIGEKCAAFIELVPQILKAYKKSKMQASPFITSPLQVFNYLGEMIKFVPHEEFYLICLDSNSKVLLTKLLAKGATNQVAFSLQQITQTALQTSASGIILVHNHPSGTAEPSSEDIVLTKKVYLALSLNGICVMDHLIISKDDYYSFNKNGLFNSFMKEFNTMLDFSSLRQKSPKYEV